MSKIAVILIRGLVGVRFDIKDALRSLNLEKKHACAVVEDTPSLRGLVKKTQSYTTYGVVDDETIKLLETRRKDGKGRVYFLAPPKGGFERKGIKIAFNDGGALGDRGDKIVDLIKKMV